MTNCWVITEGMRGTENQCLALAEACGVAPVVKVVKLKQPWKLLTPWWRGFSPDALARGSSRLDGPWPDLIIASGRKAIAPALWVKKQTGGRAVLVIVQSPVVEDPAFDLVIAPLHDEYRARNAMAITGALSLITPARLDRARDEWEHALGALPGPRIAVLIGGNSRTHKMTKDDIDLLMSQLQNLLAQKYSIMITVSRRTPQMMQSRLQFGVSGPRVFFWNGQSLEKPGEKSDSPPPNPYLGLLAWADAILVTEDSVSMACEAISTGKPVYIVPMSGGSKRFARFHDNLVANLYARWFNGAIEEWRYTPPNDLADAAAEVKAILAERSA